MSNWCCAMKTKISLFLFLIISFILCVSAFSVCVNAQGGGRGGDGNYGEFNDWGTNGDKYGAEITQAMSIKYFDTNYGTSLCVNNLDIFCTNERVLFYNSSGNLVYSFICPSFGADWGTYQTRIIEFNSSAILIGRIGGYNPMTCYNGALGFIGYILNTNGFVNKTWTSNLNFQGSLGLGYGNCQTAWTNLVLFKANNNFYCYASSVVGCGGEGYSKSFDANLIKFYDGGNVVTNMQHSVKGNAPFIDSECAKLTGGGSYVINSKDNINEVYILCRKFAWITNTYSYCGNFTILKVNCVTPATTNIFGGSDLAIAFGDSVTWFDYTQITFNSTCKMYVVVCAYSVQGDGHGFYVNTIRFNDTFKQFKEISSVDSVSSGNTLRVFGASLPRGEDGKGHLIDGTYDIIYVGQNYKMMAQLIEVKNVTTPNILDVYYNSHSANTFAMSNFYYSTSNNIGGYISPFGMGNMLQIDFQNGKIIDDYLGVRTNPPLTLMFGIAHPDINEKTLVGIVPYGNDYFNLSVPQHQYDVTAWVLKFGTVQTGETYNVYSTGFSTSIGTFNSLTFNNAIVSNAITEEGDFYFSIICSQSTQKGYESYRINVTLIDGNSYTFRVNLYWQYLDSEGNTPPPNGFNPDDTSGGNGGTIPNTNVPVSTLTTYMIYFFFLGVPSLGFGYYCGKNGINPILGFCSAFTLMALIGYLCTLVSVFVLFIAIVLDIVFAIVSWEKGRGA